MTDLEIITGIRKDLTLLIAKYGGSYLGANILTEMLEILDKAKINLPVNEENQESK